MANKWIFLSNTNKKHYEDIYLSLAHAPAHAPTALLKHIPTHVEHPFAIGASIVLSADVTNVIPAEPPGKKVTRYQSRASI